MSPFSTEWSHVINVLISAPLLYVAVVALVRISGKRSTSKMNTFDWVVTVALGSMLASGALSADVPIGPTLVGVGVLLGMQWVFTRLATQYSGFRSIINGSPTLLFFGGAFLDGPMKAARVARGEILAAIRENGFATLDEVAAVVLESDGELSVLGVHDRASYATLDDVEGAPDVSRSTA